MAVLHRFYCMLKSLILMSLLTNPEGRILYELFIYLHTLYMRAAKSLASMCICAESPEHSLLYNAIRTEMACACLYIYWLKKEAVRIDYSTPVKFMYNTRLLMILVYRVCEKQRGSWSTGFMWSHLFWIYTVFKRGYIILNKICIVSFLIQ